MVPVVDLIACFFFFKQKTAYEILSGLVGSEMCIRDSLGVLRECGKATAVSVPSFEADLVAQS